MEIIIIDSGVYLEHPALKGETISGYGLSYNPETQRIVRTSDFEDHLGHGTSVYGLVRKGCKDAEIKNIRAFNTEDGLNEEALCAILEYVFEKEAPSIINLSLGITLCENEKRLYKICRKIYDKGIIIISAFDNGGAISYPAAFDCVYGVNGMQEISHSTEMWLVKDSYVKICAKGTINRLMWRDPDYIFLAGNSFSCAMVTGVIASYIMENGVPKELHDLGTERMPTIRKPAFKISKAAVFPLNKEINTLLRFQSMLPFEITAIYDHRLTGHVDCYVGKLLKFKEMQEHIVQDITNICWEELDTLILGHTGQFLNLTKDKALIESLFNAAKENNVNVYSFDPCEKSKHTYFPQVSQEYLPVNHFGKLFKINKPVLCIAGTSSRQGKFSLQITLKKYLKDNGYCVGCFGTEPSSFLFGMEEIFPYGYNSTVSLSESEAVIYLNRLMKEIERTDCDIILTGAQSAMLSGEIENLNQFIPYQQAFLYGTAPDTVILVISVHDSSDYIRRTISYIENVCGCKILAITFLPRYITSNNWGFCERYVDMEENEVEEFKKQIFYEFGINTYVIGNKRDELLLVEKVIEFF